MSITSISMLIPLILMIVIGWGFLALIVYLVVLLIKALRKYLRSGPVRQEKAEMARSLGETLRYHRTRCKMTQEFVAEAIGVSRQAASPQAPHRSLPPLVGAKSALLGTPWRTSLAALPCASSPDATRSAGLASGFCSVGRGIQILVAAPRRRKLRIVRFRPGAKAHSLHCGSFPHKTRFAGLLRGPRIWGGWVVSWTRYPDPCRRPRSCSCAAPRPRSPSGAS